MKKVNVANTHASNLAALTDIAMVTQAGLTDVFKKMDTMTASGPLSRFGAALVQFSTEAKKLFPGDDNTTQEKIRATSKAIDWVDLKNQPNTRDEQFWHNWAVFFVNLRRQANEHSAGSWLSFHELSELQSELLAQSIKQKNVISDMLKTIDQRRTAVGMGWFFIVSPASESEKSTRCGVYIKNERVRKTIAAQTYGDVLSLTRKLEEVAPRQYLLCPLGAV